jgi:hypothetical protein
MNERTIHRKLQVILDVAQRRKYQSLLELRTALEDEPPISFMYRKAKDHKLHCSTRSILRTLRVAINLGLLERESGKLTDTGVRATDPQKFDRVIGKQAADYLEHAGTPLSKITTAINRRLLRADPPITPTAVNIWSALDEPMAFPTFALYLRLIGFCGVLATSQAKIFLPR